MSTWLTTGELTSRLATSVLLDLADDDANGVADSAVLTAVLMDAEGVIESRLGGRYPVPLTSGDKVLSEIGAAIAIHQLYLRKSAEAPRHIKEAYDAALARLDRIASHQAGLSLIPPARGIPETTVRAEDRNFTEETLNDY
jgi:phage gp36-like protein